MTKELTDKERIALIRKTLRECGQRVTDKAVRKQFRHETGRDPE